MHTKVFWRWVVWAGLLLMAAGDRAVAAESGEPPPLPAAVVRLDAERASLEAQAEVTVEQAAAIRREASDLERRRQEVLRQLDQEAAALAAREQENQRQAAEQAEAAAARAVEVEHILRAGGAWVSFTDEIAPLLRARCIACHSSREPGGGHVLTTYAGLFSAGVNGPAVVPGAPDSLLCDVVADGSMPQDSEPLSADEVDLIRRWVALGARLDAGAESTASLVRIMPRPSQPLPPEVYPAALPVSAIAFDPTGTRLASSGYHEVLCWDISAGASSDDPADAPRLVERLSDLTERVHGLVFTGDGQRLAVAAGTPGVIGEVTLATVDAPGQAVSSAPRRSLGLADDGFLAVAFSPDGSRLAAASADTTVRLYDTATGEPLSERSDHADWVQAVAFSPDGSQLVSASRDTTAKLVDLASGKLRTTFSGHGEPVTAVCWLGDGDLVATGGADASVRIWRADSGKEVRKIDGFRGEIDGLCLLSDGRLAVADRSGEVRLHAVADGKHLRTIQTGGASTTSLAASPDSRLLAVGSLDGSITLIDLAAENATEPRQWRAAP